MKTDAKVWLELGQSLLGFVGDLCGNDRGGMSAGSPEISEDVQRLISKCHMVL